MKNRAGFSLCSLMLIGALPSWVLAGDRSEAPVLAYSMARETSVSGSIEEVVSGHSAGSPAGLHVLVSTAQGITDASVGSYLSADVRESLSKGQAVQVVGMNRSIDGKDYLVARTLTVAGHAIAIRNEHGFLIHPRANDGKKIRLQNVSGGDLQ
jgi:hypothetical protein